MRYLVIPAPGGWWELWDAIAGAAVFMRAVRTAEDAGALCERYNRLYQTWLYLREV